MNTRVVFLDLDGVLNSDAWFDARELRAVNTTYLTYNIDPVALARLNRLCATTGAYLVFASTWRHGYSLRRLNREFTRAGCTARFIGKTPDLPNAPRGLEIARWLADYHAPICAFVILDDGADMGDLQPRLVQTDHQVGLLDTDVDRAIALLKELP